MYYEFENLRVAGIRYADLRGYSYDRSDVSARGLANAYAQTLGTVFTQEPKPYEIELVVAEVGETPERDQIYRLTYDGSVADQHGFVVMGGASAQAETSLRERWADGLTLGGALRLAVDTLAQDPNGGPARTLTAEQLEVAVLDRQRPGAPSVGSRVRCSRTSSTPRARSRTRRWSTTAARATTTCSPGACRSRRHPVPTSRRPRTPTPAPGPGRRTCDRRPLRRVRDLPGRRRGRPARLRGPGSARSSTPRRSAGSPLSTPASSGCRIGSPGGGSPSSRSPATSSGGRSRAAPTRSARSARTATGSPSRSSTRSRSTDPGGIRCTRR